MRPSNDPSKLEPEPMTTTPKKELTVEEIFDRVKPAEPLSRFEMALEAMKEVPSLPMELLLEEGMMGRAGEFISDII